MTERRSVGVPTRKSSKLLQEMGEIAKAGEESLEIHAWRMGRDSCVPLAREE